MNRASGCLWLALALAAPACAQEAPPSAAPVAASADDPSQRTGREIYTRFRAGLAEPNCDGDASARWRAHFAHAPRQLVTPGGDVLPLFGYVVDALREAGLPTEYALIPFVESGYRPGARSAQGPAGLWQMIAITARGHQVPIRAGYDGRLSPVDSTAAAVRYLKTLHRMFAGDWRLTVMAYNAGEYRVLGALKRSGQTVRTARPDAIAGLSPITQAYVRKLHALSCLMEQAYDRGEWADALDHQVPRLEAVAPDGAGSLAEWARRHGQDVGRLQRLNPPFAGGGLVRVDGRPARLLAVAAAPVVPPLGATDTPDLAVVDGGSQVASASPGLAPAAGGAQPLVIADASTPAPAAASDTPVDAAADSAAPPRRHTVARGDNPSRIAGRYGIKVAELLARNGLTDRSVLRPGKVLLIDAEPGMAAAGTR